MLVQIDYWIYSFLALLYVPCSIKIDLFIMSLIVFSIPCSSTSNPFLYFPTIPDFTTFTLFTDKC